MMWLTKIQGKVRSRGRRRGDSQRLDRSQIERRVREQVQRYEHDFRELARR